MQISDFDLSLGEKALLESPPMGKRLPLSYASKQASRMMRRIVFLISAASLLVGPNLNAQQPAPQQGGVVPAAQGQAAGGVQPVAGQTPLNNAAPKAPFPPLNASQKARLDQILLNWQTVSQSTKTLECSFQRWHYDLFAAPKGVHASKAKGILRYSSPDKGLFEVKDIMFFKGMKDGKPQYGYNKNKLGENQSGEHWVCNGRELIEFDKNERKCTVHGLPPELQGKDIFNSPLPFVFNLDATKIHDRYWVREATVQKPGVFVIEAFPKLKEDSSQYRLVQVAVNAQTFIPQAIIMYAPNFDPKTNPQWDHYELTDVKRNAIGTTFLNRFNAQWFIPEKPKGKDWEVIREPFVPATQPATQPAIRQAAQPAIRQAAAPGPAPRNN